MNTINNYYPFQEPSINSSHHSNTPKKLSILASSSTKPKLQIIDENSNNLREVANQMYGTNVRKTSQTSSGFVEKVTVFNRVNNSSGSDNSNKNNTTVVSVVNANSNNSSQTISNSSSH